MESITAHIVVRDAAQAAAWYSATLGAEERTRLAVPGGKLMQVELRFGDSTVMLADEFPEWSSLAALDRRDSHCPSPPNGGRRRVVGRAVDGGAEVRQPLADAFWGERYGQIIDPFGHCWGLAQHLRDVPQRELEDAVTALFSKNPD